MHLSQQRHQNRGFAYTSRTDDKINSSLLKDEFVFDAKAESPLRRSDAAVGWSIGPCEMSVPAPYIIFMNLRLRSIDVVGGLFSECIQ